MAGALGLGLGLGLAAAPPMAQALVKGNAPPADLRRPKSGAKPKTANVEEAMELGRQKVGWRGWTGEAGRGSWRDDWDAMAPTHTDTTADNHTTTATTPGAGVVQQGGRGHGLRDDRRR